MKDEMSKEIDDFLDKLDLLCREYECEIWPTDKKNTCNKDGTYPTLTIHGKNDEIIKLAYIDGDGRGK